MKHTMRNTRKVWAVLLAALMVLATIHFDDYVTVYAASDTISVAVDSTSAYSPTQIINGDFSARPHMAYTYNGTTYNTWPGNVLSGEYISQSYPNGTNGGWNTTENRIYIGSLFEYYCGSGVGRNGNGGFVEMNAFNSAVLYQDLSTTGGDVIRWTLKHCSRKGYGDDPQRMYVQVGAPEYSGGKIVAASGLNSSVNAHIQSATLATYQYNGITNGNGTLAFANASDLAALSVAQSNNNWNTASGIYVIPSGQTVTRFAFIATGNTPDGGNLLDDITFSTLVGNLSASGNSDGSATVKGYWGDSDKTKKFCIKIGDTVHQIDMQSVLNRNFEITIPASMIGNVEQITVYHQDYVSASKTLKIVPSVSLKDCASVNNTTNQFTYPNAAVTGYVRSIMITVDSGSFSVSKAADIQDQAGYSKTFFVADAAAAQALLRSAKFTMASGKTTQNVTVTVSGETIDLKGKSITITQKNSADGVAHYYGYVKTGTNNDYNASGSITFSDAYAQAKSLTFNGLKGYLATITSAAENTLLDNITGWMGWGGGGRVSQAHASLNGDTFYTGGSIIPASSGSTWYWVCGPEAGQTINSYFTFWNSGEPNGSGSSGEYLLMLHFPGAGRWNDINNATHKMPGYFVEWSEDTRDANAEILSDEDQAVNRLHQHCDCGEDGCTGAGHNKAQVWTATSSLPTTAGYYYLTSDVTVSKTWTPADGTHLCLNGHVIRSSGSVRIINVARNTSVVITDCNESSKHNFKVEESGLWTLTDETANAKAVETLTEMPKTGDIITVSGGVITGANAASGSGIYDDGTLYLYGGNVVGNTAEFGGGMFVRHGNCTIDGANLYGNICTRAGAGAIHTDEDGILTLKSGRIQFNCSNGTSEKYGAAVQIQGKVAFYMTGGEISYNRSTTHAGGIMVRGGSAQLTGGIVTKNDAALKGDGVYLSGGTLSLGGNVDISGNNGSNLYLPKDKTVAVLTGASAPKTGMKVGVTTAVAPTAANRVSITGNNSANYESFFVSDDSNFKTVNTVSGDAQVVKLRAHEHAWSYSASGATLTATCTDTVGTCDNTENTSVTILAPEALTYDGTAKAATLSKTTLAGQTSLPTISYSYKEKTDGEYADVESVVNAGFYRASFTIGTATASVEFEVTKASLVGAAFGSAITYGDKLNNSTISGTAFFNSKEIPGKFTWNDGDTIYPAVADSNATYYTVTFTPDDAVNFNSFTKQVQIQVLKAEQDFEGSPVSTDETIDAKNDGTITGLNDKMEYRIQGGEWISVPTDATEVTGLSDGKYYIRLKADDNHNPSDSDSVVIEAGRKLNVTIPEETEQVGYILTTTHTEASWNDSVTLHYELKPGYTAMLEETVLLNGAPVIFDENGDYTFSAEEDYIVEVNGVEDITAPTGEIMVAANSFKSFLSKISFGLFFQEAQVVTVSAADAGSGVKSVEYLISEKALTEEEVRNNTHWNAYSKAISLEPNSTYVIYARLTDHAGNVSYLSSNGIVIDHAAPEISGIADGETYYTTQSFTVSDAVSGVKTVTLDGEEVTEFQLAGNVDHVYTIIVTDYSQNTVTYTVTMKTIDSLVKELENITEENVTRDTLPIIEKIKEIIGGLDTDDAMPEEKAALKDILDRGEVLAEKVEATEKALEEVKATIEQYVLENVTSENREDIEHVKAALEAIEDDNLTEEEKADNDEILQRLKALLETLDEAGNTLSTVNETLAEIDFETVSSADRMSIETAKMNLITISDSNLTEEEKAMKNETLLKLEELLKKLDEAEAELAKRCKLCGICPIQPLGICLFIWIAIILFILAVIIAFISKKKHEKKDDTQ